MAEDTSTTPETPQMPAEGQQEGNTKPTEESVPFERFKQVNTKAKEAAERAKALEREVAEMRRQMEERETAGLPELEQMKKRLEAAERRAEENDRKAQQAEAKVVNAQRERWITAAAQAANFADPSDAAAFLNLDEIEDEKDAERAVKRLAQSKKHLIKPDGPTLPGKVLENGRPAPAGAPASKTQSADEQWAAEVAPMLQRMVGGWSSTSS